MSAALVGRADMRDRIAVGGLVERGVTLLFGLDWCLPTADCQEGDQQGEHVTHVRLPVGFVSTKYVTGARTARQPTGRK